MIKHEKYITLCPQFITQILTWDMGLVRLSGLYPVWLQTCAIHSD